LGKATLAFHTYRDFEEPFLTHMQNLKKELKYWEEFEGPTKYILTIIKI
tara:strand:- start:1551 stop:1697 length:147 start_codon:yes stop_codon:yes gene_type:complete